MPAIIPAMIGWVIPNECGRNFPLSLSWFWWLTSDDTVDETKIHKQHWVRLSLNSPARGFAPIWRHIIFVSDNIFIPQLHHPIIPSNQSKQNWLDWCARSEHMWEKFSYFYTLLAQNLSLIVIIVLLCARFIILTSMWAANLWH